MTAARGRSSRQGGDSWAGSGLRQATRAPNPPCLTNASGSTEEEGAPRPSPSPWSWQTQNRPASALSPGWGDPICPCSGQLDPAPGPHLGGSPHAVGVGCSTAGRRHLAASLPHPPVPPARALRKMALCAAHRPIVRGQHPGGGRAALAMPSLALPPTLGWTHMSSGRHTCVHPVPRARSAVTLVLPPPLLGTMCCQSWPTSPVTAAGTTGGLPR